MSESQSHEQVSNSAVEALGGIDNARQILSGLLKAEKDLAAECKSIAELSRSIFENSLEQLSTDGVLSAFDEKLNKIAQMRTTVNNLKAKYEAFIASYEEGAKFKNDFQTIVGNLNSKSDQLQMNILTLRFQFEQIMPTIEEIRNRCSALLDYSDSQVEEWVMGPLNQNSK
jgi:DNA repair ATPase RecN